MARTWFQIQVELEGGRDLECDPPPGRIFMVGPSTTFAQLAEAIDVAFARWDLSHLHVFELPDGRMVGFESDDGEDDGWLDHDALTQELQPGDRFSYVFDLGDDWRHRCRVLAEKLDPREEYGTGPLPRAPVAISGWGWMPDQYGRLNPEE